jgi:hypothetical protein
MQMSDGVLHEVEDALGRIVCRTPARETTSVSA